MKHGLVAARLVGLVERGVVLDPHDELESPVANLLSGDLDATCDRVLLAHEDRLDLAGVAAHGARSSASRKSKLAQCRGSRDQGIQIQPVKNHFPLHGFLPGLEQPVADFELLDNMENRLLAVGQLGTRAVELPDQPGLEMQEAHLDSNNRISGSAEQALRLHGPGVAGFLRFDNSREDTDRRNVHRCRFLTDGR